FVTVTNRRTVSGVQGYGYAVFSTELDFASCSVLDRNSWIFVELTRTYDTSLSGCRPWSYNCIKCPVCAKFVLPDDIECHLVMCLTKPRLSYNEDVLTDDKGECVICLEDLQQGDTIARLPCLCIYHKSCIDRWFEVNRSCPEHPGD
ncbi:hypothetical protein L9F63_020910, partial [Diploptera punctata]